MVTHPRPRRAPARPGVASGSLSTGSLAAPAPLPTKRGDGSTCSQAHVRATGGRHSRRTGPSAAGRDRGHREGLCGKRVGTVETGGTGGRPGVHLVKPSVSGNWLLTAV